MVAPLEMLNAQFPGERITMSTRSTGDFNRLQRMQCDVASVPGINPSNYEIIRRRQADRARDRIDLTRPSAETQGYSRRLRESLNNGQAASEVAAYRQFELTTNVMASPFAMGAFQSINLSADELPMMIFPRKRNLQRFTVQSQSYIGGEMSSQQWRTTRDATMLDMDYISSDKVQYPLMDLQMGNLSEEQSVMQELSYDMDMKIDGLGLAQIDAAIMDSGLRATLSIHPLVNTANIPDTNHLDLTSTDYGATGKITLPKIKAILNHIVMVGAVDETRSIRPTAFVMSPQRQQDVWDFVSMVSGYNDSTINANPTNSVPEEVRNNIFATGAFANAWGYTFQWQPNSQIASNRMYVFMDQPLGWMFTKTEMDQVIKWDASNSPTHAQYSYGELMYRKALKFYVPTLWKHRILIIDL